ncbi:MAG: hypothetical protein U1F71_04340 [Verrucomicrobiaceae bacterium]
MKHQPILLSLLCVLTLSSCYVTPRPYGYRGGAHSPYSPGGRVITPMERNDRSPLSPGGRHITPAERRSHHRYGTH